MVSAENLARAWAAQARRSISRRRAIAAGASPALSIRNPVTPSSTISAIEPRRIAITGVPQTIASTTERLVEGDEMQERAGRGEEPAPLRSGKRAQPADPVPVDARFDLPAVIGFVRDDAGHAERHARRARCRDRRGRALVRMGPAVKGQRRGRSRIAHGSGGQVEAMMDRRGVAERRMTVSLGDRDVMGLVLEGRPDRKHRLARLRATQAVQRHHERHRQDRRERQWRKSHCAWTTSKAPAAASRATAPRCIASQTFTSSGISA